MSEQRQMTDCRLHAGDSLSEYVGQQYRNRNYDAPIAYSASVGGIATLIGTPPNALLAAYLSETQGISVGFAQWMLLGVPVASVMLPVVRS